MAKRCIYCSDGIAGDSVVDMCRKCMYQVWGEKMTNAILQNMESEMEKGNLDLGRVGEKKVPEISVAEEIKITEHSITPEPAEFFH